MRPSNTYSLAILWATFASSSDAFVPHPTNTHHTNVVARRPHLTATSPQSPNENSKIVHDLQHIETKIKGALSGIALAASLWAAPTVIAPIMANYYNSNNNVVIASSVANAKEMASGTGTRVNKDPESLLRYGLPINNKEV
jgi:hypothetical protein